MGLVVSLGLRLCGAARPVFNWLICMVLAFPLGYFSNCLNCPFMGNGLSNNNAKIYNRICFCAYSLGSFPIS